MGRISRVSSRTYRKIVIMGVDITDLDPYRRDKVTPKKYKLNPPEPVYKSVQKIHNGIDNVHAAVDRRVVQPSKRIYNHVVNEEGWKSIGIIVGSTILTRKITKRLPLGLKFRIPPTQAYLRLRSFSSLYTFGVFYGTLYNFYPQKAITAKEHSLASISMGWDKLKQIGSQNDDQTEEEKEVVLLSAENSSESSEIRGKDIDLKKF